MSDGQNSARQNSRRVWLVGLALIVVIAGAAYTLYWYMDARFYVATDDAYVGGDVVAITSRENGTVVAVRADNTQSIRRGDVLVELDPLKTQVDMAAAEADLATTVRAVRAKFARVDELRAEQSAAKITLDQARTDYERRQRAGTTVSQEELAHARNAVTAAQASIAVIQSGMAQALAAVEGAKIADNPEVMASIARLRDSAIAQSHMRISAPVSGVVAQRSVQVGQMIAGGTPLMAVVPLDGLWIEANFKESQLADMRVGQPVAVTADIYGGDVAYHGKIAGFGAGSGSVFALLPPQNASGNWIKIVQRVPVRIALDPKDVYDHPLRVGLSMFVKVDLHDTAGAALGVSAQSRNVQIDAEDINTQADKIVARILAANGA